MALHTRCSGGIYSSALAKVLGIYLFVKALALANGVFVSVFCCATCVYGFRLVCHEIEEGFGPALPTPTDSYANIALDRVVFMLAPSNKTEQTLLSCQ